MPEATELSRVAVHDLAPQVDCSLVVEGAATIAAALRRILTFARNTVVAPFAVVCADRGRKTGSENGSATRRSGESAKESTSIHTGFRQADARVRNKLVHGYISIDYSLRL